MPFRLPVERLKLSARRSTWILIITVIGLVLGLTSLAVWLATGNSRWLQVFFEGPGLVLMLLLTAVEVWLSFSVRGAFASGEPLRLAWNLIAISALFDFLGTCCTHWLGSASPLNPLLHASGVSREAMLQLQQVGFVMSGTLRYAILAAGLIWVTQIYRMAGFPGRLLPADWLLLALVFVYVVNEFREVTVAFEHGKQFQLLEALGWPVDPLLIALLLESRLLANSIKATGMGNVARCWKAFTIGVLLVWVGDLVSWAVLSGHLSWQWSSLSWYVWLPATGAFAAAPAYQLEAIEQAMDEPRGRRAKA